ncbi:MAG: hypothetical protein KDA42_10960 [Planctomycetales bacterium]|nr:hypothetical protein [Planctomycetales bacterium]
MGLLNLFNSTRIARQADRLANEVAHMTADMVYRRVAPTATSMNDNMARGYVRAHASVAVRSAIGRTFGNRADLAAVLNHGVQDRATTQVVHMIHNQLRMARAQQATQRKAA